jgi:hypothetical protein
MNAIYFPSVNTVTLSPFRRRGWMRRRKANARHPHPTPDLTRYQEAV